MLKKGKTTANAGPGAVTSATAQGVLPSYNGHATASLTPAAANTVSSQGATTSNKAKGNYGTKSASATTKRGENRPPKK